MCWYLFGKYPLQKGIILNGYFQVFLINLTAASILYLFFLVWRQIILSRQSPVVKKVWLVFLILNAEKILLVFSTGFLLQLWKKTSTSRSVSPHRRAKSDSFSLKRIYSAQGHRRQSINQRPLRDKVSWFNSTWHELAVPEQEKMSFCFAW